MSILDPDSRSIYLSALRPPEGYVLDRSIGTTYSLDLTTLLSVPLAFALFDRAETNADLLKDPVLLLEALRRYAERTSIFCNAGQIAAPRGTHPLFIALEPMVNEVKAPLRNGVFHPKVWALRFVGEGVTKYRVLVLTRNLTPDRSWDTVLSLEGDLVDRQVAYSRNHPLANFINELPKLATSRPSASTLAAVELVAGELRKVDFEVPEPFEEMTFWPLGIEGHSKSPLKNSTHKRALVISPFLRAGVLEQLGRSDDDVLIARPEEMDALGATGLGAFDRLFTLCEQVEHDDTPDEDAPAQPVRASPAGLHAKLYVLDHGWDSSVITGSANATNAAFERNVEFCVELVGKRSKVGIDALLGTDGSSGIANMLQPYTPPTDPVGPTEVDLQAEKRLEELRAAFTNCDLTALVSSAESEQTFHVELRVQKGKLEIPADVAATLRPVTLQAANAKPIDNLASSGSLVFPYISLVGVTAFFVVDSETPAGDTTRHLQFVVRVPLVNCPEGRMQAVLRAVVGNRENLIRYLLLLLADEIDDPALMLGVIIDSRSSKKAGNGHGELVMPVLEHLLRAYARKPEKLDAIDRLVRDLRAHPESAKLLPEGFERVWDPIWTARQRARST